MRCDHDLLALVNSALEWVIGAATSQGSPSFGMELLSMAGTVRSGSGMRALARSRGIFSSRFPPSW
jgi:hypothetical protein